MEDPNRIVERVTKLLHMAKSALDEMETIMSDPEISEEIQEAVEKEFLCIMGDI